MHYTCPKCRLVVVRSDSRYQQADVYTALSGAKILERVNEAPRVRCRCGHLSVLLRASLGVGANE